MTRYFYAALILAALPCALLQAQAVEAGRVVDDSTHQPAPHVEVLLERRGADDWKVIERTRTDTDGLFQFAGHEPGIYRVAFGGAHAAAYTGPIDTLADMAFNQREYAAPLARLAAADSGFVFLVEQRAEATEGTKPLPYPPELLNARIKTFVVAQFFVGADGRADLRTLRLLNKPPHRAFGDAVYTYLQTARFRPATINGVPVRQLVQQEFDFTP